MVVIMGWELLHEVGCHCNDSKVFCTNLHVIHSYCAELPIGCPLKTRIQKHITQIQKHIGFVVSMARKLILLLSLEKRINGRSAGPNLFGTNVAQTLTIQKKWCCCCNCQPEPVTNQDQVRQCHHSYKLQPVVSKTKQWPLLAGCWLSRPSLTACETFARERFILLPVCRLRLRARLLRVEGIRDHDSEKAWPKNEENLEKESDRFAPKDKASLTLWPGITSQDWSDSWQLASRAAHFCCTDS